MNKKLSNIKIIHSIIFISICSLISLLLIYFIGFRSLSNSKDNMSSMFNVEVAALQEIGVINGEVGVMRNALTKIIDRPYDLAQEKIVTDADKTILASIEKLKKIELNDEGVNLVNELDKNYAEYMKRWPILKETRMKGGQLSASDSEAYGKAGNELSDIIRKVSSFNVKQAAIQNEANDTSFTKSISKFTIILLVSFAILLTLCISVIIIIKKSISEFNNNLAVISKGDFTLQIDTSLNNEFGKMNKELDKTIKSIAVLLRDIQGNSSNLNEQSMSLSAISEEMTSATEEVTKAVNEVAIGASNQARELIDSSRIIGNFGEKLENIVISISDVDVNSKTVTEMAESSNTQLTTLVDSINDISKSFNVMNSKINGLGENIKKVHDIIDLINSIAEQTNLLSLNASIEAARAGEAGRGFSVVADEIRKLAEQSKNSSHNIRNLLEVISNETDSVLCTTDAVNNDLSNQVKVIENSILSFKDIIKSINTILPQIEVISHQAADLNAEKDQIVTSIETASAVAEETSASAEEISASSEEMSQSSVEVANTAQALTEMASSMNEKINKFKL